MKHIYGLSLDGGPIRYVGQTKLPLKTRLQLWKSNARVESNSSPAMRWVRAIDVAGWELQIQLLATVEDAAGDEAERKWIAAFLDLLNVAAGGAGCPGVIPSEAARAKRAASVKKNWDSQTVRVRWVVTDEQHARQVEGIKRSFENGRNPSLGMLGKRHSDATKAKISATKRLRSMK